MLKFEWKIKFFPNFFLIKKAGIIFQQCVVVSYNLFIQEHCKLINLFEIWTLLRPPFSWVFHRVECPILACFRFQIRSFWILFNWSVEQIFSSFSDFSRKIFLTLYFINWTNFIAWLPLLLEILGNMRITIICYPVCDVMNFEIPLAFLSSRFST